MQGFALLGTVTLMLGLSLATPPEKRFVLAKADLDRFTRELKDRWIKTGSRRSGQLLAERGVVPNASIKPTLQ